MNEYTAVIKRDGDWWIGWIEEVPGVNCQEATYEELRDTLELTLEEILALQTDGESNHDPERTRDRDTVGRGTSFPH